VHKVISSSLSQGGWENDETVEEAAVREAIEEAGVRGDLKVKFDINNVVMHINHGLTTLLTALSEYIVES